MFDELHMAMVKWEMAEYDRLTPEMRAVVQEFGRLPRDPEMSADEFRDHEQRRLRIEQEYLFSLA